MPQRPFNQIQRLAIMSAGAGVGLILGLLVVAVMELKDSSFRREEEVHARLSLPVLALVPIMSSDRERRALQRRTRLLDVAGTVALVAAVVVLALWQLR
jgi:hypothetical protein